MASGKNFRLGFTLVLVLLISMAGMVNTQRRRSRRRNRTTTTTTTTTTTPKSKGFVKFIHGPQRQKQTFVKTEGSVTKKTVFHTGCFSSCYGLPQGSYPSCYGCSSYLSCYYQKAVLSCSYGYKWDDHYKSCQRQSSTCVVIVQPRHRPYSAHAPSYNGYGRSYGSSSRRGYGYPYGQGYGYRYAYGR